MVGKERRGVQKVRSFTLRKIFDRLAVHNPFHEPSDETTHAPSPALPVVSLGDAAAQETPISDLDLMKERFSKLLLGEDMSGGGKGVSSAQALSNALTNLAASVFGEQKRLEPIDLERKARWEKEIDWLLSVTDYIVEFVPCHQKSKDGSNMEDTLDNFAGEQEFSYVASDASGTGIQMNDKWWLPNVKVPKGGLSEESQQFILKQKEAVNQVLKASLAINAQILSDMEIPDSYVESLPKHGRESLGELIYKSITDESFNPTEFLLSMDMSSEHSVVDLKNRIEASVVIWKRKMHQKDGKPSWASAKSFEKRELFEERAETILLLLKQNFPGLPQSSLEISKIQYNRDVGLAVMESYSRVLETLASTVLSRIQDILHTDSLAQDHRPQRSGDSSPLPSPEAEVWTTTDFVGWDLEAPEKKYEQFGEENVIPKSPIVNNKLSFLDEVEMSILRSPTARH